MIESREAQIPRITRNEFLVSSVHSKPSRSKIITRWCSSMTTNRSIRKKLLAKHSYAVLLFPSLSRSFYFLTAFYFSPLTFDCHRFIQLSFTDKRARSHRLYRWDIECSLPFLFNAYSINWRGITSNDFIGR